MRAASEFLVPLMLSAFIAIISAPPLFWLRRRRVPAGLAVFIVIIVVIFFGLAVGALVGTSLDDFVRDWRQWILEEVKPPEAPWEGETTEEEEEEPDESAAESPRDIEFEPYRE